MAIVAGMIVAAVGLYGASQQADAASEAANTQAGSAASATGELRRQYNLTQARLQPWSSAGTEAIYKLSDLLGLKVPRGDAPTRQQFTTTSPSGGYWAPPVAGSSKDYSGSGGAFTWMSTPGTSTFDQQGFDKATADFNALSAPGPDTGSLLQPFTGADLENEPGYQFRLKQGELGINRNASATGMRLSPATQKALARFNSDYAATEFGSAFNRNLATNQNTYNMLTGASEAGRGALTNIGALGQTTATQIGENTMGAGNALAAGQVAGANAYANAGNNAGNQFTNYMYLDKYLNSSSGGGGGGYGNYGISNNQLADYYGYPRS